MLNLDSVDIGELEEFLRRCEEDKTKFALELFPQKHPGFVRDVNFLERYCKDKIEAIKDRLKGRIDRALKHEANCEKHYRSLSDFARW